MGLVAEDTFCLFLELKGRAPLLTEALLLRPWAWQLGQCEHCRGLDIHKADIHKADVHTAQLCYGHKAPGGCVVPMGRKEREG